jgi:hypothetical protein
MTSIQLRARRCWPTFAYEVQSNPTSESSLDAVRIDVARKVCRDFLVSELALPLHDAEQRARRLLTFGEEVLGILVRKSPEEVGFLHRAFQEFLAAKHIASLPLVAQIGLFASRAADARWRDVLLFVAEAASRPNDVEQLVEAIETVRSGGPAADWSISLLLADITFGDARRPAALTRRLALGFCDLVETGADLSERTEVLRRVIAGLSNEQTAALVRPRLATWFPAWSDYSRTDVFGLIADWPPDPMVDQVLWRALQDDLEQVRLAAALGLAKRCARQDAWRDRLVQLSGTTSSPEIAAAAVWSLIHGWPEEAVTRAAVESCAESPNIVLDLMGVRGRIRFGDLRTTDRDRLLERVTEAEWGLSDGTASVLGAGWSGDPVAKQALLEAQKNRTRGGQSILLALAKMFPQDDEVAAQLRRDLRDHSGFLDRHDFYRVLAENFHNHPEMQQLVTGWAVNKDQTYDLAHAAGIAPIPALRTKILDTLKKPEFLIFWSVDALLDIWGMADPDVARALKRIVDWPLETLSDVADRLPEILEPEVATPLLREMVTSAATNTRIRADKALKGLKTLGATSADPSLVDDILNLDLLGDYFVANLIAVRLLEAFPDDPRVVAFALRALPHRDGLISVITLVMGHRPEVRQAILNTAAPLPSALRQALVPLLQARSVDDANARDLLAAGQREVAPGVIVASAVGSARTRLSRAECTSDYRDFLRGELNSVGPLMDGRRFGAFAASVIAGWPGMAGEAAAGERGFHIAIGLGNEARPAYEAIATHWTSVSTAFPEDELLGLLNLDAGTFIDRFADFADQAPVLRKALDAAETQAWLSRKYTPGALRYFALTQPRSGGLLERCLSMVADTGRSWNERQLQLTAAEVLAHAFVGDAEVLTRLGEMLEHELWPGPIAALCDGWPDSALMDRIFDDLAEDRRPQNHLDNSTAFKVTATKSRPERVVRNLESAATQMDGGYWDAIPFWLPTTIRRIRTDDAVSEGLMARLAAPDAAPSAKLSFASLVAASRGVAPQLTK